MSGWMDEVKSGEYEEESNESDEYDIHVFSNSGIVHVDGGESIPEGETRKFEDSELDEDKYERIVRDQPSIPKLFKDQSGWWIHFTGKKYKGPSNQYFAHVEENLDKEDAYDSILDSLQEEKWAHPQKDNKNGNELLHGLANREDVSMTDYDIEILRDQDQPIVGVPSEDLVSPTIEYLEEELDESDSFAYSTTKEEFKDHEWPDSLTHPKDADIILQRKDHLDEPKPLENAEEKDVEGVPMDVVKDQQSMWERILNKFIVLLN